FLAEGGPGGAHCLVLDLHMPEMDGLELVGELHRRSVRTPTIMVTGRKDDILAQRARKADVLALLYKPVAAGELIGWIERAVEQRPAAG
ncbi:MAG: response regulator, partial [Pseudomonadota bacterium]|nr:response regulator [Pseudomonadota bacterium]